MASRRTKAHEGFRVLLWASGVTLALWFIPYAEILAYPVRLFVTLLHESAHALASLVTGGSVAYIRIRSDGGGITATRGGLMPIISSAGYLGTVLYGSVLLAWCKDARRARVALGATALLIAAMTLFFVRPLFDFGFWIGAVWSLFLGVLFFSASARVAQFLTGFLAVQSCLNALFDLKMLFALSASEEAPTDALAMQEVTLIPAVVWALLWSGISAGILVFALRGYRQALR